MKNVKLIFFVTFAHLLVLIFFTFQRPKNEKKCPSKIVVHFHDEKEKIKEKKPVVKKTLPEVAKSEEPFWEEIEPLALDPLPAIQPLSQRDPVIEQKIKEAPPVKKTETPKKPKPVAKKENPKPKEVKKEVKKPVQVAKPSSTSSPREKKPDEKLLQMMKEGLTKIDKIPQSVKKSSTASKSTQSSKPITKLMSESLDMTPTELSYAQELAIYIKHHLHFPEIGELKLQLVLHENGKVKSFAILASSSNKNKELAEKTLSSLSFPSFGSRFQEKSKSFTLMLNIE